MDALAITVNGEVHVVAAAAERRLLSVDVVRVVRGPTEDLAARDDVRLGVVSYGDDAWVWPERALCVGDEVRVRRTTADPTPPTVLAHEPLDETPADAVGELRAALSYLPTDSEDPRVDALRERLQGLLARVARRETP